MRKSIILPDISLGIFIYDVSLILVLFSWFSFCSFTLRFPVSFTLYWFTISCQVSASTKRGVLVVAYSGYKFKLIEIELKSPYFSSFTVE